MTQRETVLRLLVEDGVAHAHDLTYHYGITRTAAIVHRLRQEGYMIETIENGVGMMASYRLRADPRDLLRRVGMCAGCGCGYAQHLALAYSRPHAWQPA